MTKQNRNIVLLLLFIGAIVLLRLSGVGDVLTLESLQQRREELTAAVRERYALSLSLYILAYIAVVALSIPGATVMTLAGGLVFGTLVTVLAVNAAATAGAVLAFLSARYLLGESLQERYREQLARFNTEIESNGPHYLLTLRLIPVFPFFLVNFLSGLTRVPLATFVWTTSLGIIPGSAVYAFAGGQLETVHSIGDVLSTRVLLAFGSLALFTLAPAIISKFRRGSSSPPSS
ncbi:MAG: TVP38/TMEM64 family protein [Nitrospirae bacterium]|nr:TVP38/TMEM64 family protein [Nitrospirota bacterium]